jgi:hypothetical protein
MSIEAFAALKQNPQRLSRLERIQRAVEAREHSNLRHRASPGIQMSVSPWYVDELGVLTRQISATE